MEVIISLKIKMNLLFVPLFTSGDCQELVVPNHFLRNYLESSAKAQVVEWVPNIPSQMMFVSRSTVEKSDIDL